MRREQIYAVPLSGTGGVFFQDSPPRVADVSNVDAVTSAIQLALASSVIPSVLPPDLHLRRSELPQLAGVKNDSAFSRGAALCTVRILNDGNIELLRGETLGGATWQAKPFSTLPSNTSPMQLTDAVLNVLVASKPDRTKTK